MITNSVNETNTLYLPHSLKKLKFISLKILKPQLQRNLFDEIAKCTNLISFEYIHSYYTLFIFFYTMSINSNS